MRRALRPRTTIIISNTAACVVLMSKDRRFFNAGQGYSPHAASGPRSPGRTTTCCWRVTGCASACLLVDRHAPAGVDARA